MTEKPTVIKKTREEVLEKIQHLLSRTPYRSVAELRKAVFFGDEPCCSSCYDYGHPHAETWQELTGWLYLADIDWKTGDVAEEMVPLDLGDDYYTGAYFAREGPHCYEVPRSQFERWKAAQAAYEGMQREIEQVMQEQCERARERRAQHSQSGVPDVLAQCYVDVIQRQLSASPLLKRQERK